MKDHALFAQPLSSQSSPSTQPRYAPASVVPLPAQGLRKTRGSKLDALIAAARDEFATNGFEGTHIGAVTQRVGIRKSTFFHYFADKVALYDAAVGRRLVELAESCEGAARTEGAAFDERIMLVVGVLARATIGEPVLGRLVVRSLFDRPPPDARAPTPVERILVAIAETLREGTSAGLAPVTDLAVASANAITVTCLLRANVPVTLPDDDGLVGETLERKIANAQAAVRRLLQL